MQALDERLQTFAAALLDPELEIPTGLVGPDGLPSRKRFNVYRNNVVAGLTATLKDAYPAVGRIVGDEFFAAMGRIYVALEPPASPVMLDYGRGFPAFLGSFPPLADLPYLADVAAIERAWVEAYHTADIACLPPAAFADVDAADLPNLTIRLHPSWRIVRSRFPALTIWQMNIADGEPFAIDLDGGAEDALLLRAAADVEVRRISFGVAEFIGALGAGDTVLSAMKQALSADPRFDLATCLSGLMTAGAIIGFDIAAPHTEDLA